MSAEQRGKLWEQKQALWVKKGEYDLFICSSVLRLVRCCPLLVFTIFSSIFSLSPPAIYRRRGARACAKHSWSSNSIVIASPVSSKTRVEMKQNKNIVSILSLDLQHHCKFREVFNEAAWNFT